MAGNDRSGATILVAATVALKNLSRNEVRGVAVTLTLMCPAPLESSTLFTWGMATSDDQGNVGFRAVREPRSVTVGIFLALPALIVARVAQATGPKKSRPETLWQER